LEHVNKALEEKVWETFIYVAWSLKVSLRLCIWEGSNNNNIVMLSSYRDPWHWPRLSVPTALDSKIRRRVTPRD
jgi:hypothetical protein